MTRGPILQTLGGLWSSEPVKRALVPLLNALPLYLLFPLHPGITIPTLLAAVGSIALWPSVGFAKFKSRGWSITLLISGLLWAVVSPYLMPSGTLYFYRANSNDPRQSEILSLGDSPVAGHLIYLTDPIRPSATVRGAMKLLGFEVEFLERPPDDSPAIVIPLSRAIRYRVLGAGASIYAEELITSYTGTELDINIFGHAKRPGTPRPFVSVGPAAADFPLVDYVRNINNSPDRVWNAVAYTKENEKRVARYAAELDLALSAASEGDFQSAIGTLESAFETVPTELEQARLYTLLGYVSSAVVGGNAGSAQGLAFFNQAMRHWPRAVPGNRLSRAQMDDPVDRWLFDSLKVALSGRDNEYPTWSTVLGNSDPHVRQQAEYHSGKLTLGWWFNQIPDTPVESLIDAERQRLIGIVKRSGGNPQELSMGLRKFVSGRPDVARWGFSTLFNSQFFLTGLDPPWSDALNDMAAMCVEPWKSRYLSLLGFLRNVAAITLAAGQENDEHTIQEISSWLTSFGFSATARSLTAGINSTGLAGKTSDPMSPAVPWWNRKYLDWFGSVVLDAYSTLDTCANPGPGCREVLEGIASRSERDDAGKGRLFAPGLATALILSKAFRQPIDDNWMVEYRQATGIKEFVWPDEATMVLHDPPESSPSSQPHNQRNKMIVP